MEIQDTNIQDTKNQDTTLDTKVQDKAIELNAPLIPLVHYYLSGYTISQCAMEFNLSEVAVSDFLNRREVKQYISTQLKNQGFTARQKRLELLSRIVSQKIEFAEENELPMSNKDIIEVLKLIREENNDLDKLSGDTELDQGKAQYIQIINQLKA